MFSPCRLAWTVCGATVLFVAYHSLRPAPHAPSPAPRGPLQPAAGLAAPAPAPRRFGGQALGEASHTAGTYSNEALHQDLEAQKARLGIRRIIPPSPLERSVLDADRGRGGPEDSTRLQASPAPAPVAGTVAALLAQPPDSGRGASRTALLAPDDFSGPGDTAARKRSTGESWLAPTETGRAVHSAAEMSRLWRDRRLPGPAPSVDFSRQMLLVVFGRLRIESVDTTADRMLVRSRITGAPAAGEFWRIVPRRDLPVSFVASP